MKTEVGILKSPSVLMPVFDYVKNNDSNLPKNIDYKTWLKSNFEIKFQNSTSEVCNNILEMGDVDEILTLIDDEKKLNDILL